MLSNVTFPAIFGRIFHASTEKLHWKQAIEALFIFQLVPRLSYLTIPLQLHEISVLRWGLLQWFIAVGVNGAGQVKELLYWQWKANVIRIPQTNALTLISISAHVKNDIHWISVNVIWGREPAIDNSDNSNNCQALTCLLINNLLSDVALIWTDLYLALITWLSDCSPLPQ